MIPEKEIRECIDVVKRIEELVGAIEQRLVLLSDDLRADLESVRERYFWEEYHRCMDDLH